MDITTNPQLTPQDLSRALYITSTNEWTQASSKKWESHPHEYLVRHEMSDEKQFWDLLWLIRKNHVREFMFGRRYPYLYLGQYKYWINVKPDGSYYPTAEYYIINRAKIDQD